MEAERGDSQVAKGNLPPRDRRRPSRAQTPLPAPSINIEFQDKNITISDKQIEQVNLSSIERYVKVLLDSYPFPLSQKEIASKANVSKTAVSKIKNELKSISDLHFLAYEKKYVLKNDIDTNNKIINFILECENFEIMQNFISSQYFLSIIKERKIYSSFCDAYNKYNLSEYFSEDDFNWIVKIIQKKVAVFNISKMNSLKNFNYSFFEQNDIKKQTTLNKFITISSILADDEFSFLTYDDYMHLLNLRDKTYFLILSNFNIIDEITNKILHYFEIVDNEEKTMVNKTIILIAKKTALKIIKVVNKNIYQTANKNNIKLDEKYENIGSIFVPKILNEDIR